MWDKDKVKKLVNAVKVVKDLLKDKEILEECVLEVGSSRTFETVPPDSVAVRVPDLIYLVSIALNAPSYRTSSSFIENSIETFKVHVFIDDAEFYSYAIMSNKLHTDFLAKIGIRLEKERK